jgi:hypothetical protein
MQLPGNIKSADIFDGVLGVLTEVVAKKISSEEEMYSGKSLMIFYNNWLGAYSQIAPFAKRVRIWYCCLSVSCNARAMPCVEKKNSQDAIKHDEP